jgi:uncharacterized membrane protein
MVKNLIRIVCLVVFFVCLRLMEKKNGEHTLAAIYLMNSVFVLFTVDFFIHD